MNISFYEIDGGTAWTVTEDYMVIGTAYDESGGWEFYPTPDGTRFGYEFAVGTTRAKAIINSREEGKRKAARAEKRRSRMQ